VKEQIRAPEDEREFCRWLFSDWCGLTYADVRPEDVLALEGLLCVAYARHELDANSAIHLQPARRRTDATRVEAGADGHVSCAYIRCDGAYFRGREAVSLNPDGFIGIAGWADDENVRPFATALKAWVTDWLVSRAMERECEEDGDEDEQG
jgi:hypothetical protein